METKIGIGKRKSINESNSRKTGDLDFNFLTVQPLTYQYVFKQ